MESNIKGGRLIEPDVYGQSDFANFVNIEIGKDGGITVPIDFLLQLQEGMAKIGICTHDWRYRGPERLPPPTGYADTIPLEYTSSVSVYYCTKCLDTVTK